MSYRLFDAIELIGTRIAEARYLLVCLDFDGTLTPIRVDPGLPVISPQIERVLWALASFDGISIAIISGRERADLQARVGVPGLIYAGNHGLEISGPGRLFVEPTAAGQSLDIRKLAATLSKQLQHIPGTIIENKGLTLSVHFRQVAAHDGEEVRRIVHAALASTDIPLRLTMGNMVYEIRPPVGWNKGNAVHWILEQLDPKNALVIYVGDDAADEEAFAVLSDCITIKVGNGASTAAHFQVEGPAEVRKFLEWLESIWGTRCRTCTASVNAGIAKPVVFAP